MPRRTSKGGSRAPDKLTIYNERIKLVATATNAVALAIIGFALLRPIIEDTALAGPRTLLWVVAGLAIHGLAHYILGMIEKEAGPDDV